MDVWEPGDDVLVIDTLFGINAKLNQILALLQDESDGEDAEEDS